MKEQGRTIRALRKGGHILWNLSHRPGVFHTSSGCIVDLLCFRLVRSVLAKKGVSIGSENDMIGERINRREFLRKAAVASLGVGLSPITGCGNDDAARPGVAADLPNLVLVTADDLGAPFTHDYEPV